MERQALLSRLRTLLGHQHVLTAAADKAPFLTDWRGRYQGNAVGVLRPGSVEEIAEAIRLCADAGLVIVPQGGNTGLCGGATPGHGRPAMVFSLSRMNRIRRIDTENDALVAEAGCTLASVQQAAEQAGRLFPLALASQGSCEIGGNLSTNAGGVHVLRYGNMRELTLGLEVVLADGRVWSGLRALRKDNTGYDLKQLFIGAEGTLGIISAATLKLFPRLRSQALAWVAVSDPCCAVQLLGMMREHLGERLTAFELIGGAALGLVLQHIPGARRPLDHVPTWSVLVELGDPEQHAPLSDLLGSVLSQAMQHGWVQDAALADSLQQYRALWSLREDISEAQKREGLSIKHDISVPVSSIPAFLARAENALMKLWPGLRIVAFGHLGDGNLHYNLSLPDGDTNAALIEQTAGINRVVHDIVHELEGSISAEHGIGQLKCAELQRYKSNVEIDLMQAVKAAIDPRNIMNPGKILRAD